MEVEIEKEIVMEIVGYTSKSGKTANYKVLWRGVTKSGEKKVKLSSLDGSFEFFVADSAVMSAVTTTTKSSFSKECWECGRSFTKATMFSDGDWYESYCGC